MAALASFTRPGLSCQRRERGSCAFMLCVIHRNAIGEKKYMATILAIDDKKENLMILSAVIHAVFPDSLLHTALNGPDGIELAIAHDPDVILLDIMMPEMNGFDVCLWLKQDDLLRDIPVVFLTAVKSDKENRIEALEVGAEGFLSKPIDKAELTAQLRAMVMIKAAHRQKRSEQERLRMLVAERTRELEENQIATLKLLDELKAENEIRRIIEAELRESEEKSRAIVSALPDLIFRFDKETRFIDCEYSEQTQLFFPKHLLLGKKVEAVLPDGVGSLAKEKIELVFAGKKEQNFEYMLTIEGEKRWFESRMVPCGTNEVLAITRDMTGHIQLQNQFIQAQKVQSLGTLAGGIAHDFNNILGIILGYATMLENNRIGPQDYDKCIHVIIKNVERGTALVQQILTYARRADVSLQPLRVPDFISELIGMLKETFPKTIIFTETYASGLPDIVGDRTQIHQVLLNLCVNARDAMPNGGSIDITVDVRPREEIQACFPEASEDHYLSINVSDTGIGMDEDTRLRVFDPFFTTKDQGKGTGLGLSVVYGVVQSHHGFIDVKSRIGQGTEFSLFLPAAKLREKNKEESIPSMEEIRGGTETVLVVEDEEFLLKIICMSLEGKGYRFIIARDGQEAVELFGQHHKTIDVVLTDIGLPHMNGFDVFKQLRAIDPHVKVIVASGFFEPAMKDELQRTGAKAFINKPYRPLDVLRVIRQVLDE
jgi:two-component system, cell cycle sensor histidine kinase and response regulator CckA